MKSVWFSARIQLAAAQRRCARKFGTFLGKRVNQPVSVFQPEPVGPPASAPVLSPRRLRDSSAGGTFTVSDRRSAVINKAVK